VNYNKTGARREQNPREWRVQDVGTALVAFSLALACHASATGRNDGGVSTRNDGGVSTSSRDTADVVAVDRSVVAFFKDTAPARILRPEAQEFDLQTPTQRQALRATIKNERELWKARKPRDYQFLLRVECFCPGVRGWLLMQVRNGQLRAWDKTGRSAALTDWNTLTMDSLYSNLERTPDINGDVLIAFDPRWHFPAYARTVYRPGPDAWSIVEVRGFRPI